MKRFLVPLLFAPALAGAVPIDSVSGSVSSWGVEQEAWSVDATGEVRVIEFVRAGQGPRDFGWLVVRRASAGPQALPTILHLLAPARRLGAYTCRNRANDLPYGQVSGTDHGEPFVLGLDGNCIAPETTTRFSAFYDALDRARKWIGNAPESERKWLGDPASEPKQQDPA
jgi:hypothetical protein